MAKLKLLYYPDERLYRKSEKITTFDDKLLQLIEDLTDTMFDEDGVAIAAPQVNIHKQVIIASLNDYLDNKRENVVVLINPEILNSSGEVIYEEGCLSLPGIFERVKRYMSITLKYYDQHQQEHIVEFDGFKAHCVQHEVDHLHGKVFADYLSPLKQQFIKKKLQKTLRQQ
jgi:peptide deformylase